eukprot:gene4457-14607_t
MVASAGRRFCLLMRCPTTCREPLELDRVGERYEEKYEERHVAISEVAAGKGQSGQMAQIGLPGDLSWNASPKPENPQRRRDKGQAEAGPGGRPTFSPPSSVGSV